MKVERSRTSETGYTLVELLVVISILATLASMLFPAVAQVRETVRGYTCLSNLRQISSAITMYSQDYDETMPPWADCAPIADGSIQNCATSPSTAILWPDSIQPYLKSQKELFCPSFNAQSTAQAIDAANCDGNGTPGSASAGVIPADKYFSHYGLAYPLSFGASCDTTGKNPYAKFPGSGWVKNGYSGYFFQLQTLSGIVNPARTVILGDGVTFRSHNSNGPFVGNLFGCEGRFRHRDGANVMFADGHTTWLAQNPEQYLEQDSGGCYYEKYYTADR